MRTLDAIYADRTPIERVRARNMLYVYALAAGGVGIIFLADMSSDLPNKLGLGLTYAALLALLLGGIGLVFRGRDGWALHATTGAFLVFSAGTLMVAFDGMAPMFFKGWSRWYPVFIAMQGLFLARRAAGVTAVFGASWSVAYYVAFLPQLEGHVIVSDVVDTALTQLIVGAIVVFLVGSLTEALGAASAALDREHALNTQLEQTVAQRTSELQAAVEDRQTILDHMADGLLALTPEHRIVMMNERFSLLLDAPARSADTVYGGMPRAVFRLITDTAATGESTTEIMRVGRRSVQVVATRSSRGEVILTARDVTREREVDRLKTEFIATVSHELRTPLTSVLGFTKMTRSRLADRVLPALPDEAPRAAKAMTTALANLDIVILEGQRLTELINDVLDIAKMEAGRVEWRTDRLDAVELVTTSAAAVRGLFPPGHPVELVVELETEGTLVGDGPRLTQVLVNLLSNAAKFTEQGRITLRLEAVDEGLHFSVSDTGPGIPESQHEAVFDRFRQVEDHLTDKPKGSGLGLPICRQIVHAHGSEIQLESTPGEGSRFGFTLPVAPPA